MTGDTRDGASRRTASASVGGIPLVMVNPVDLNRTTCNLQLTLMQIPMPRVTNSP
jgi:hypothetical protein